MKIILVGSTGTIGKKVAEELSKRHQVINASRTNADIKVNIETSSSIEAMYKKVGKFDAVISATGEGYFGPLKKATDADFRKGINSKLMGQVNLVLIGQHYINAKGSFTLTSGSLAHDPIVLGANLSAVNAAVDGFIRSAAIELDNGVRINSVAPTVVEESPGYFP